MKTFLQTMFFFLLVTQICFAQLEFFNNRQQQIIFSEERTDDFTVNLDSLMLDSIIIAYKNSQSIPGIATLIIKDNEIIWSKDYGYRNLQFQLPVEDSTYFLMGSISKTILATAIMQLWENGLIDLEGNINNYLPPDITVVNPYFPSDTITVKMLMTHTSSLQDNWNIMDYLWSCGDYPVAYDSFLVNYFTPGGAYYSQYNFHNYRPGQDWDYSNAGSCLLALMVEHLSGKSFEEYTRDSIFVPLSMNNTSWFLSGMDTSKIATPYMYQPPVPMCQTGMAYWPIGQIRTNKLELTNFLSAYMNGGVFNGNRILNSSTIELMLTDQSGFILLSGGVQGLIWYTDPRIYNTVWGHSGGWYGAATWMFYNPQEKWGIIFFINWATPPNYTSNKPTPQMAYYAHLFGNIYALNPSVDKSYVRKDIDTVLFRTKFSNRSNHQFIPRLIFANIDSTQIDSLTLFDDGLHGDSLSNDGIFGNYIPPQQSENYFHLSVSTIDNSTGKYFNTPDICGFTTVGPLTIDSLSYSVYPTYYRVKPYVTNHSNATTITNASIKLSCSNPWVTSIIPQTQALPDIPPGATVSTPINFTVQIDTSIFENYFDFNVEISIDGWAYWQKTIPVPPRAIISINPTALVFGGVPVESSVTKTFTIANNGNEALIISDMQSSVTVFTVNVTTDTIPPYTNKVVEVTFTPTALQTYSGVIEIIHNAEGSPDTVIVNGDGVTDVEDDLQPLVYSLEQNYPNPFNPTTSIKYSIPEVSKVRLTLFNLLGEEVAILVNEEKIAGYYKIEFNAANLPSGVYFYQLKAGSFVETKKMILLK